MYEKSWWNDEYVKQMGRTLKQVYNMKQYQKTMSGLATNHDKDLIYDLLEQHYHGAAKFVSSVNLEKRLFIITWSYFATLS